MMDRLLYSTLNTTILALITAAGAAALLLGFVGLSDLFNGQSATGGCALFAALVPALTCLKLCWYRNDLVDR